MGMLSWGPDILVPLGAFAVPICIVAVITFRKMRERELQAHEDLRVREMEHERRLKELEIEKLKLEIEKSKIGQAS